MSLQEHLAAIKAKSNPPDEIAAVMKRCRKELADSALADKVPQTGTAAPEIELPNIYGDTVSSSKILSQGPLVLHFFRGGW